MLKIATHDSCTGEKCANFFSWLLTPFAKTQTKTIAEQLNCGVRMFDLRARMYKGSYHPAHGPYIIKRELEDIIAQINAIGEPVYAMLTYEGKLDTEKKRDNFRLFIDNVKQKYTNIIWGKIYVKYTDNDIKTDMAVFDISDKRFPNSLNWCYIGLNGRNWQTFLPIPWLWKKVYFNNPVFNEEKFTIVDFL